MTDPAREARIRDQVRAAIDPTAGFGGWSVLNPRGEVVDSDGNSTTPLADLLDKIEERDRHGGD